MKIKSILAAIAISLILSVYAHATTDTWTGAGTGTNYNFSNTSNWGGVTVASGDALQFATSSATAGSLTSINNDFTGYTFSGLTFLPSGGSLAGPLTMGGNSFTLTGGITNNNSTASRNVTINNAITISGNQTWMATNNNAITILGGNLSDATTSDTISINGNSSNGAQLPTFQLTGSNSAYKGTINFVSGDTGGILLGSAGAMTGGLIDTTTGSHNNLWLTANSSGSPYTFGIDGTQTSGARVKMATGGGDGLFLTANNGGVGGGSVYWDPGAGGNYSWTGSGTNADTIVVGGSNDTNPDVLYLGNSSSQFIISGANKTFKIYNVGNNAGYLTLQSGLSDLSTDTAARTLTSNLTLLTLAGTAVNNSHPLLLTINPFATGNPGSVSISNVNQLPGGNLSLSGGVLILNGISWDTFATARGNGSSAGQYQLGTSSSTPGGFASIGNITIDGTSTSSSTFAGGFTLGSAALTSSGAEYATGNVTLNVATTFGASTETLNFGGNSTINGSGIYTLGSQIMTLSGTLTGKSGGTTVTLNGINPNSSAGTLVPIVELTNASNSGLSLTTASGGGTGYGVLVTTSDAALGGGTVTIAAATPGSSISNSGWLLLFAGGYTSSKSISYTSTANILTAAWGLGSYSGNSIYAGTATIADSEATTAAIPFNLDAESGSTFQLGTTGTAATLTNNSNNAKTLQYRKTGAGTAILNNVTFNGSDTTAIQFNIQNGALQETGSTAVTSANSNSTIGAFITLNGGVLETNNTYESGGFVRSLGASGTTSINMAGGGGFSAYGGPLTVNLGGASAGVTFGSGNFVNSGTALVFGSQTSSGTVTFVNPIALNAVQQTIQVNSTGAANEAVLTGTLTNGGLIKTGTGVLSITGSNTYTGATTINAGTLSLDGAGALNSGSAVAVNNGGTLAGTGNAKGAVTVASGGTVNPGTSGVGTLTVGSITFQTGSDFALNLSGATTTELIITGAASIASGADITFTVGSGLTASSYTLATAASGLNSGTFTGTAPTGYNLVYTGTTLKLVQSAAPANQAFSNATATFNIITGATTTVGGTLTNTASSGANALNVSLTGTGTGGNTVTSLTASTGSTVAVGTPASVTGTFTAGAVGTGQTWTITNTDNTATTTSASATGTVNVYNHALGVLALTGSTTTFKAINGATVTDAVQLTNSGANNVNLNIGTNSLGLTGSLTAGGSQSGTGSLVASSTAGAVVTGTFSTAYGDDQSVIGHNALGSQTATSGTITITSYNKSSPSLSGTTTNFGTVHAGATVGTQSTVLSNAAGLNADLQINSLGGLTDTGSGTIIVAGTSHTLNANVGTLSTAGTYTQAYSIGTQDSASYVGATVNGTLTYTVTGQVYSGNSTWATNGSGAWGTLTGTGTNTFGTNWGATQGSPGLDSGFTQTDSATFGAVAGNTTATVSLNGASPSLKAITFSTTGGGYTIAQGTGTGSITLSSTGTATITDTGTGSASHTISAPIVLASDLSTTVNPTDKITLSGSLSGSHALTKAGAGTLLLSGSNTYTGGTTVTTGTLQLAGNSVTSSTAITSGPVGTGLLTLANGTTLLDSGSIINLANAISLGGTINLAGTGGFNFDKGNLTTGNNVTLTSATTLNVSDTSSITDNIVGGYSLTKIGSGTLTLTGTNSSSAPTTVTSGTVTVSNGGSLGSGSISLASGTALQYNGTSSGTLNNAITVVSGATATVANTGTGTLTLAGTLNKANSNLVFNAGGQTINVTGTITSTGATGGSFNSDAYFTNGTTTLNSANSYSGPTHIYGNGTVVNGVNNALPTSTIVELGNSDSTATETGASYTNTYVLNGTTQSIAGLSSTNPTTGGYIDHNSVVGGNSGTTSHLTLTGTGTSSLPEGIFGTNGNSANNNLAVTFSTSNAVTLTGSNTYTGATTITSGTLVVSNTNGSATGTGALTLNNGAVLTGTGTIASSNNTILGTVTPGTGATDTSSILTLTASGTTNFTNASLTFNLDTVSLAHSTEVALGSTPSVVFGNTSLTLNLVGGDYIPSPTGFTLFTSTANYNVFSGLGYNGNVITSGLTFTLTGSFASTYAGSYLELVSNNLGGDNIVAVVPEPSTWALMLGGLVILVAFQRLRRSKDV
jgi:autotransporter-associated beta strand protein